MAKTCGYVAQRGRYRGRPCVREEGHKGGHEFKLPQAASTEQRGYPVGIGFDGGPPPDHLILWGCPVCRCWYPMPSKPEGGKEYRCPFCNVERNGEDVMFVEYHRNRQNLVEILGALQTKPIFKEEASPPTKTGGKTKSLFGEW